MMRFDRFNVLLRKGCLLAIGLSFLSSNAAAQGKAIEEIVITAQKREETLRDAPISVTALSGNMVREQQINNIIELESSVPSMRVSSSFGITQIFVRGLGLDNVFPGFDPSVAMHVDGAVIDEAYAQSGAFFDLERIEAVRGPQGDLYGRNATGGSINLVTAKPTEELEGYGQVTLGNFDMVKLEGALSGPIYEDKVLGRVAFKSNNRSGYGRNVVTGNGVDDANKWATRGHLQFNFTEDVSFLLSGEFLRENDSAFAFKFRDVTFQDGIGPNGVPGFDATGIIDETGEPGFAENRRDLASERDPVNDRENWAVTGTLDWDITDKISLRSITNFRSFRMDLIQDLDASREVNMQVQNIFLDSQQYSEELQLSYNSDRLNGLLGFYYFQRDHFSSNSAGFLPPTDTFRDFEGGIDVESWAVFTNWNYNFYGDFSLILGGRFTSEDRSALNRTVIETINLDVTTPIDIDFDDFTPRIGLEWNVSENFMLYSQFSEGVKSGIIVIGFNAALEPEKVDSYEAGIKASFLNNSLNINLTGFKYNVKNLQVGRTIPVEGGAGFQLVFENAAAVDTKGIELEGTWHATDNLRFSGFAAYLDSEFEEFFTTNPIADNPEFGNIAGNTPSQSPEWTARLNARYEVPLKNGSMLQINGGFDFSSEVFFTPFEQERLGQDSVTIVDASIKYTDPGNNWNLTLWGNNLTDKLVYETTWANGSTRTLLTQHNKPRTYGLTLGYEF